jgi:acyl dehydratase
MALNPGVVGKTTDALEYRYEWKDCVLYALGIGARAAELDYLYEVRGPKVYPTLAVVPAFPASIAALSQIGGNMLTLVHGGQRIVVHKPFASSGTLRTTATVTGVYDKVKFGQAIVETRTTDAAGALVSETVWSILYRGEGGFGGPPPPKLPGDDVRPPERAPDFTHEESTAETQALLYRLSGDVNPLHADPAIGRMAGFGKPILHGLCTYGHAARAVILNACGGDGDRLRAFDAQFRKPVWPGDTLVTEGWKEPGGRVVFTVKTKERGEAVITNAYADVKE